MVVPCLFIRVLLNYPGGVVWEAFAETAGYIRRVLDVGDHYEVVVCGGDAELTAGKEAVGDADRAGAA